MNAESKAKLARILAGLARNSNDQTAWESLYNTLRPFVMATVFRVLWKNPELANDATQETFFRIFRYPKFCDLQDPDRFLPYLSTVAKHVAWDMHQKLLEDVSGLDAAQAQAAILVVTPEQRERMRAVLSHVLEQLTPEEHRIVDLLIAGLSVSQIADELGTTYSAAGVRIHRLRQTLPKLL